MTQTKKSIIRERLLDALKENDVPILELIYRHQPLKREERFITTSLDAYNTFLQTWDFQTIFLREEFKIMLIKRNGRLIGIVPVSIGREDSMTVDQAFIAGAAILSGASAVIVAHNHPSEILRPSDSDKQTNLQIKRVCTLLDISFRDHLIITPAGFYSFAESGQL